MGKKSTGKGGPTKTPKLSKGLRYARKCNRLANRLEMKIRRWDRNRTDPGKKHVWTKGQQPGLKSRHKDWNTAGLKKQVDWLRAQAAKGKRNRKTWT